MASTEQLIISKIIEEHSLEPATRAGIKPAYFSGEWEPVFQWIVEYATKHGETPSEHAFSREYGDIKILDTKQESFTGLFDELIEEYRLTVMAETMTEAMQHLDNDDVSGTYETLQHGVQAAGVEASRLRDFNIIEGWEERYRKYEEMRADPNALRGIPTGFEGLDKITHGLRPQQFIVMAGEPKRGKSLFALIMANAAHRAGRRPLFISFEMSVDEQLARYDALSAGVAYDHILSGDLTNEEMQKIRKSMVRWKNMHPYYMSEDSSKLTTVSAVRAKVQEFMPDLLVIDGVYMMDDENGEPKGSPQALTNITRSLKSLAQWGDIPILSTTQVLSWKLGNKKTRAITGDSIGYTSSFVQDADLVLGVERNSEKEDQSIIRVVEARTAPHGEVHVQWDWNTMEFEEVHDWDEDWED